MKRAVIYYFTGTGNTLKAVNIYKTIFVENGIDVKLVPIKYPLENITYEQADYLGFAYPVHAFNAPKILIQLAYRFPKVKDVKYFIIKTSGEPLKLNNISSLYFKDILKKKGYNLCNEYHYVMPYNMIFRHTDNMAYKMVEALRVKAPIDAKDIIENKKHKLAYVPFGRIIAFIFRVEHIAMNINGRYFKIDYTKCIMCRACERGCPTNNITFNQDGKFAFGNNCIMCTHCSFMCPKDAFKIGILNNWRVNGNYSFEKPNNIEIDKHKRYCKKAYDRYFKDAEKICGRKFD